MRGRQEQELRGRELSAVLPNDFPTSNTEVPWKSSRVTQKLVTNPALQWSLEETVERRIIEAGRINDPKTARQAQAVRTYNNALLNGVNSQLEQYDWSSVREKPLTHEEAAAILDHLPFAPVQEQSERTPQQRIAIQLAKGYLVSRFEQSPVADWRGSLRAQQTLLEAATVPQANGDRLRKWFAITTGNFEEVMPQDSVAWRAIFYGTRAIRPEDEKYLKSAIEMNNARFLLADIFDMRDEAEAHSFNPYLVRLSGYIDAFNQLIKTLPLRENDLLPSVVQDHHQEATRSFLAEHADMYGDVDIEELEKQPFTAEMAEVVQSIVNFRKRYEIIQKLTPSREKGEPVKKVSLSVNPTEQAMYERLFALTPAIASISRMVEPSMRGRRLFEYIRDDVGTEGLTDPVIIPFLKEGVRGYYVAPNDSSLSQSEWFEKLDAFFDRVGAVREYERMQKSASIALPYNQIGLGYERIYLVEHGERSDLSLLLDRKIPDEVAERAFEYFEKNNQLRNDLPARFRRGLSTGGDRYHLLSHPDMPGAIDQAIIRRTKDGPRYEFHFQSDPSMTSDEAQLVVRGKFAAEHGRLLVTPDEDNPGLSADQEWIVESILLTLIEKSLCLPESEAEQLYRDAEDRIAKTRRINGYPGYIGHLAQGKKFTRRAYELFERAKREMHLDIPNFDLETINKLHDIEDFNDDRDLTWNTGQDVPEDQAVPIERVAPDKLFPPLDVDE